MKDCTDDNTNQYVFALEYVMLLDIRSDLYRGCYKTALLEQPREWPSVTHLGSQLHYALLGVKKNKCLCSDVSCTGPEVLGRLGPDITNIRYF